MAYNYISVSGVGSESERTAVSEIFRETQGSKPMAWFVGVQSSSKSQLLGIENRMGRHWHPIGNDIVPVLQTKPEELGRNVLHFACSEKSPEAVYLQVQSMLARFAMLEVEIEGMQLNGLRIGYEDYRDVFELIRHLPVRIVQLSRDVIHHTNPTRVADYLSRQPIMHVLLDTSGGTGEAYRPDDYKPWVDALSYYHPHHIGIAGGLSAETLPTLVEPLLALNPELSVDAEGRLRSGGPDPSDTRIDLQKVRAYVEVAYDLLAA